MNKPVSLFLKTPVKRTVKRAAFTLIELLVVIAIIALLAAILFPVFARARENARKSSCLNNLKQLGVGIQQYTQDFDETLPGTGGYVSAAQGAGHWTVTPIGAPGCTATAPCRPDLGALFSYIKNEQVYLCPSDTNGKAKRLSYAMNSNCGNGAPTYYGRSLADATRPAQTILFVDESSTLNDGYFAYPADIPSFIHLDGANNAFLDGHVKWKNKTQYQGSDFTF